MMFPNLLACLAVPQVPRVLFVDRSQLASVDPRLQFSLVPPSKGLVKGQARRRGRNRVHRGRERRDRPLLHRAQRHQDAAAERGRPDVVLLHVQGRQRRLLRRHALALLGLHRVAGHRDGRRARRGPEIHGPTKRCTNWQQRWRPPKW